jgi:cyclohexyl-isocyanide hydratase
LLPLVGATPVRHRVVKDGPVITGAGVTAGLDFALTIVSELIDDDAARAIQLAIENDPAPHTTPAALSTPDRS